MKIILASSSPYRRDLLKRIVNNFSCVSPDIDETSNANEAPEILAERLAVQKALAAANTIQDHSQPTIVIGSDQVAWTNGQQLHKPGNRQRNIEQLEICSGSTVDFFTGLAIWNSKTQETRSLVDLYRVHFRKLSDEQIRSYVDRERAFDCAGGFKMEGLGISLFKKLEGTDPNSLIGLPLIQLINLLEEEGLSILA